MQTITTIGLDIAKSVFLVHGVDAQDERLWNAFDLEPQVERKTVRMNQLAVRRFRLAQSNRLTLMFEHEFRDRARDICVAHRRQRTIVKDQPLTIDAGCGRGMIFVWDEVFQDNDLHIVLGMPTSNSAAYLRIALRFRP